jgi:thymidylate synthase
MGVHMRSNDLVFGLGNDAPCFHWFHQLAFWLLKPKYPDLQLGRYVHHTDSLHIYERHWEMAQEIGHNRGHWQPQVVPVIGSTRETEALIAGEPIKAAFSNWLYEVEL